MRHPILLPPMSAKQRKRKEDTKEKVHSVCPARPPPPRHRSKFHLTSIPYIHRWGLRSPVLARGLGPPRSSLALRSSIALLLFCQPRSTGSARRCPPHVMWVGSVVIGRKVDHSSCSALSDAGPHPWGSNQPPPPLALPVGGLVDRSGLLPVSLCRRCVGACQPVCPRTSLFSFGPLA